MDPEVTLNLCDNCIENEEYIEALFSLLDYYHWRIKRGSEPNKGDERAANCEVSILNHLPRSCATTSDLFFQSKRNSQ